MTTRELIHAEIANVPDEKLADLYGIVREFSASPAAENIDEGIMAKLSNIRIVAPADFSDNLDLYTSGEKRVVDDVH